MTAADLVRGLFEGAVGGCLAVLVYRLVRLQKTVSRLVCHLADARVDLDTLSDPELGMPAAKAIIRRRKLRGIEERTGAKLLGDGTWSLPRKN